MNLIDDALLDRVRDLARKSPSRRAMHLFHKATDPILRTLNAIEPDSYVQPHRHDAPGHVESLLVLRGRAAVLTFERDGMLAASTVIAARGGARALEIPGGTWHGLVSLEAGTVLYEVAPGPYTAGSKTFGDWAPAEDSAGSAVYFAGLRAAL